MNSEYFSRTKYELYSTIHNWAVSNKFKYFFDKGKMTYQKLEMQFNIEYDDEHAYINIDDNPFTGELNHFQLHQNTMTAVLELLNDTLRMFVSNQAEKNDALNTIETNDESNTTKEEINERQTLIEDFHTDFDRAILSAKQLLSTSAYLMESVYFHIEISVRLANVLKQMGVKTFSDLVSHSASDYARQRNLGYKSFKELKKHVESINYEFLNRKFVSSRDNIHEDDVLDSKFDLYLKVFKATYNNQVWFHQDTIENLNISVRLKNALMQNQVTSFVKLSSLTESDFRTMRNLGRKSLQELIQFLNEQYPVDIEKYQQSEKFAPIEMPPLISIEDFEQISEQNNTYFLDDIFPSIISDMFKDSGIVIVEDLLSIDETHDYFNHKDIFYSHEIKKIVDGLKEPYEDIINKTFKDMVRSLGKRMAYMIFLKSIGKTLEYIGIEYGVTRERARQVISKANRKLSMMQGYQTIRGLLKVISKKNGFLYFEKGTEIFEKLFPLFKFVYEDIIDDDFQLIIFDNHTRTLIHDTFKELPDIIKASEIDELLIDNNLREVVIKIMKSKYINKGSYYFSKKPSQVTLYKIILEECFDTIRIHDDNDLDRFKKCFKDIFLDDSIDEVSNRAMGGTFERLSELVLVDRGTYKLLVPDLTLDLLTKIEETINATEGIAISTLFELFKDELVGLNILNRYQLHGALKKYLPHLYTNRDYIASNSKVSINKTKLLDEFVANQTESFTADDLKKHVPGVSYISLYNYTENDNKIINIYGGKYVPTHILKLSELDKSAIFDTIQDLTDRKIVITSKRIFYEILGHNFSHVLTENSIESPHFAYNFIKYYFKDFFNFKDNCISDDSIPIGHPRTRILNAFKDKNKFSINELFRYAEDNFITVYSMKSQLEAFYDEGFMRIDDQTIINKGRIRFPEHLITSIEEILSNSFVKGRLLLSSIETYDNFPKISLPWNNHLLAHLIKNYSGVYYIEDLGTTYTGIDYEVKENKDE